MRKLAVRMGLVVIGLLVGVGILSGCTVATPETVVSQKEGTEAVGPEPTSSPAAISTSIPTMTLTSFPTALPTSTPSPTALPSGTPSQQVEPLACEPQPVTEPFDQTPPAGDPGVYTVIGVASDDRLNGRACPGVAQPVLFDLEPFRPGVLRAGQNQDVEGYPWTPVSDGQQIAWVNAGYLARQFGAADLQVAARAGQIVWALREQDWKTVAAAVHPEKGVRFSPYAYVRASGEAVDQVFGADELAGLAADPTRWLWGSFDGTGDPIEMAFVEYYGRFVYDADFAWAFAVGYDTVVGRGNTINNLTAVYPETQFVEYYMSGSDPEVAGMDWRSLRLVFEELGETWYLVGIVHDEWTI